ncbi:MAG: DNA/RNA non-specific endonuclease [Bacteroidales bacterium]|nr:DNA/RNA non-specific endonuclease [Bacteroidales bacterium]
MYIWDESENNYVLIEGEVLSFQTLPTAETGYQRGYYELPYMDAVKSGEYLVSSSNSNNYYAYHMCAGGETYSFNGKQITARNYTVCFSGEDHVAYWVAAPRHAMYEGTGRHESYKADPSIPSGLQYLSKDTGASCNKGHILGSAERNGTVETNRQVFYYSNIAPQLEDGFNTGGGGWNTLEDWVDTQVCSDTLYQVVGCYFKDYADGYGNRVSAKTISFGGRTDVSFPTMFYYVLIRTKKGNSGKALKDCSADELKCAAFVRSHTNNLKGQEVTSAEMMSVADLEKITGFTYFVNVPNAPKNTVNASDWGL